MGNTTETGNPFRPGTMVVTTLSNLREKFWGAILELSSEGLSLRGRSQPAWHRACVL